MLCMASPDMAVYSEYRTPSAPTTACGKHGVRSREGGALHDVRDGQAAEAAAAEVSLDGRDDEGYAGGLPGTRMVLSGQGIIVRVLYTVAISNLYSFSPYAQEGVVGQAFSFRPQGRRVPPAPAYDPEVRDVDACAC